MHYSPLLILHIVSGTVGLTSGLVAAFLRKGTRRHAVVGSVFVVAMIGLGSTGAMMGFPKHQMVNGLMAC